MRVSLCLSLRSWRTLCASGCFALSAASPASAWASASAPQGTTVAEKQDSSATSTDPAPQADKVIADTLFQRGRELMAESRFEEACRAFTESNQLDFAVGTLMNLALCYKQWGRSASAWSTYRSAAAAARDRGQTERQEVALEEAKQLEASLSYLVIRVPEPPPGLMLVVDGATLLPSLWGSRLPVDPGPHTLVASAPGLVTQSFQINITELETEWTLPLLAHLPAPEPPPPVAQPKKKPKAAPPIAAPKARESSGSLGLPIAFGFTLTLSLGAAVSGALYLSERSDYQKVNADKRTQVEVRRQSLERAETLSLVNLGLLGGAVVAASVTTYLWFTERPSSEPVKGIAAGVGPIVSGNEVTGFSLGVTGAL